MHPFLLLKTDPSTSTWGTHVIDWLLSHVRQFLTLQMDAIFNKYDQFSLW